MPTTLANGVVVFNATPHPLNFWCRVDEINGVLIVAPVDRVINAYYVNQVEEVRDNCDLVSVTYKPLKDGMDEIERIREKYPQAIIVGSAIAAQAYKGLVAAPVPARHDRGMSMITKASRPLRPDRFTIYKEN